MDNKAAYPSTFDGLLQLISDLRGPSGCPWDKKQSPQSMSPHIQEECYELLEAIDEEVPSDIAGELGDVLFHVAFQIQYGTEDESLTKDQVFRTVIDKLIMRHPHVFGDTDVAGSSEVESNWHAIKLSEKGNEQISTIDGIPNTLPALPQAQAIQSRAALAGFEWKNKDGVLAKVSEELAELMKARCAKDRESEFGDLLFSVVNAGRWMGLNAESALRKTDTRFRKRYREMERLSVERGTVFNRLNLDEKEHLWQEAKKLVG